MYNMCVRSFVVHYTRISIYKVIWELPYVSLLYFTCGVDQRVAISQGESLVTNIGTS